MILHDAREALKKNFEYVKVAEMTNGGLVRQRGP